MITRIVAAATLSFALVGCMEEPKVAMGERSRHENGLSVEQPVGFTRVSTPTGYVFTEEGDVRAPRRISIERTSSNPLAAGSQTRDASGGSVEYSVAELGAGSAGTEYEIAAARKMADGYIILKATEQTEDSPAFDAAWAVLDSARIDK